MFRCTKELKGLVIDYDNIIYINKIDKCKIINSIINCIFITSNLKDKKILEDELGEKNVLYLGEFQKSFSPSLKTHIRVLEMLNLETYEIAYVSSEYSFIKNSCSFLSVTIWLSNSVEYDKTKNLPDLIVEDIDHLIEILKKKVTGFFGEICIFPGKPSHGIILNVGFDIDNKKIRMYVVGRTLSLHESASSLLKCYIFE